ncbi:hypothetical protein BLNAU_5908 [Blattamonas nauphoetae]|uniref:Uncharacterized protein n=1 Tax=Blattamonas nauphoetae TaxID=2049346 RepID=A0ABQ9Y5T6_9EUKA|nr:hypothetical protein BLNAU_5908 [Blattamonas nauphoetae]
MSTHRLPNAQFPYPTAAFSFLDTILAKNDSVLDIFTSESIDYLLAQLSFFPRNWKGFFNLGLSYFRLGEYSKAKQRLLQAYTLSLNKCDEQTRETLVYFLLASEYYEIWSQYQKSTNYTSPLSPKEPNMTSHELMSPPSITQDLVNSQHSQPLSPDGEPELSLTQVENSEQTNLDVLPEKEKESDPEHQSLSETEVAEDEIPFCLSDSDSSPLLSADIQRFRTNSLVNLSLQSFPSLFNEAQTSMYTMKSAYHKDVEKILDAPSPIPSRNSEAPEPLKITTVFQHIPLNPPPSESPAQEDLSMSPSPVSLDETETIPEPQKVIEIKEETTTSIESLPTATISQPTQPLPPLPLLQIPLLIENKDQSDSQDIPPAPPNKPPFLPPIGRQFQFPTTSPTRINPFLQNARPQAAIAMILNQDQKPPQMVQQSAPPPQKLVQYTRLAPLAPVSNSKPLSNPPPQHPPIQQQQQKPFNTITTNSTSQSSVPSQHIIRFPPKVTSIPKPFNIQPLIPSQLPPIPQRSQTPQSLDTKSLGHSISSKALSMVDPSHNVLSLFSKGTHILSQFSDAFDTKGKSNAANRFTDSQMKLKNDYGSPMLSSSLSSSTQNPFFSHSEETLSGSQGNDYYRQQSSAHSSSQSHLKYNDSSNQLLHSSKPSKRQHSTKLMKKMRRGKKQKGHSDESSSYEIDDYTTVDRNEELMIQTMPLTRRQRRQGEEDMKSREEELKKEREEALRKKKEEEEKKRKEEEEFRRKEEEDRYLTERFQNTAHSFARHLVTNIPMHPRVHAFAKSTIDLNPQPLPPIPTPGTVDTYAAIPDSKLDTPYRLTLNLPFMKKTSNEQIDDESEDSAEFPSSNPQLVDSIPPKLTALISIPHVDTSEQTDQTEQEYKLSASTIFSPSQMAKSSLFRTQQLLGQSVRQLTSFPWVSATAPTDLSFIDSIPTRDYIRRLRPRNTVVLGQRQAQDDVDIAAVVNKRDYPSPTPDALREREKGLLRRFEAVEKQFLSLSIPNLNEICSCQTLNLSFFRNNTTKTKIPLNRPVTKISTPRTPFTPSFKPADLLPLHRTPLQVFTETTQNILKILTANHIDSLVLSSFISTFQLHPSYIHVLSLIASSLLIPSAPLPHSVLNTSSLNPSPARLHDTNPISTDLASGILINIYNAFQRSSIESLVLLSYSLACQRHTQAYLFCLDTLSRVFMSSIPRDSQRANRTQYILHGRTLLMIAATLVKCETWKGLEMAVILINKVLSSLTKKMRSINSNNNNTHRPVQRAVSRRKKTNKIAAPAKPKKERKSTLVWRSSVLTRHSPSPVSVDLTNISTLLAETSLVVEDWMEECCWMLLSKLGKAAHALSEDEMLTDEESGKNGVNSQILNTTPNWLVYTLTTEQKEEWMALDKAREEKVKNRKEINEIRAEQLKKEAENNARPTESTYASHTDIQFDDDDPISLDDCDTDVILPVLRFLHADVVEAPFDISISQVVKATDSINTQELVLISAESRPKMDEPELEDTQVDPFNEMIEDEQVMVETPTVVEPVMLFESQQNFGLTPSLTVKRTMGDSSLFSSLHFAVAPTASTRLDSKMERTALSPRMSHFRSIQQNFMSHKMTSRNLRTTQFVQHQFQTRFAAPPPLPTSHYFLPDYLDDAILSLDLSSGIEEKLTGLLKSSKRGVILAGLDDRDERQMVQDELPETVGWPGWSRWCLKMGEKVIGRRKRRSEEKWAGVASFSGKMDLDDEWSDVVNEEEALGKRLAVLRKNELMSIGLWQMKELSEEIVLAMHSQSSLSIGKCLTYLEFAGMVVREHNGIVRLERMKDDWTGAFIDRTASAASLPKLTQSVGKIVGLTNLSLALYLQHSDTKAQSAFKLFESCLDRPVLSGMVGSVNLDVSSGPYDADSDVWKWYPSDEAVQSFFHPFHNFAVFMSSLCDIRSHLLSLNTLILLLRRDASFVEGWNTLGVLLTQHNCFEDALWVFEIGRGLCKEGMGAIGYERGPQKVHHVEEWMQQRMKARAMSAPVKDARGRSTVGENTKKTVGVHTVIKVNQQNTMFLRDVRRIRNSDKLEHAIDRRARQEDGVWEKYHKLCPQEEATMDSLRPQAQRLKLHPSFAPLVPEAYHITQWPDNSLRLLLQRIFSL